MIKSNTTFPTKFDAIVVGAGPAGAASAYVLSKKGFKVLLVDRSREAGSKELYGGRIYLGPLKEVWPDLDKKAPIHRWIKKERASIMGKDGRIITIEYNAGRRTSFTAYLPELVRWMVSKAEEEGTIFVDEVVVDELLTSDGKVVGIRSGPDEIRSDVVIDAEGVNRLLLEKLGLVSGPRPEELALGIKEVLKVRKNEINAQFNVDDDEGVAWILMGDITLGIPGGGFIYTFNETISIGIVIHMANAIRAAEAGAINHSFELVENLRLHPYFNKLWKSSDVIEYGAHLTIEDGLSFMPKRLVYPGLLIVGDAAGLILNTGYTVRGVDFAVYSGKLAAEAVEKALSEKEGATEENLKVYEDMVRKSFMYNELKRHRASKELMKDPEFFTKISRIPLKFFSELYEIDKEVPTAYEAFKNACRSEDSGPLSLMFKLWGMVKKL